MHIERLRVEGKGEREKGGMSGMRGREERRYGWRQMDRERESRA